MVTWVGLDLGSGAGVRFKELGICFSNFPVASTEDGAADRSDQDNQSRKTPQTKKQKQNWVLQDKSWEPNGLIFSCEHVNLHNYWHRCIKYFVHPLIANKPALRAGRTAHRLKIGTGPGDGFPIISCPVLLNLWPLEPCFPVFDRSGHRRSL